MAACDARIDALLEELNQGEPPAPTQGTATVRHNPPRIPHLGGKLVRFCGVDALVLPGIGPWTWLKLTGELGTDLSRWRTVKHFTSWLGLAPNRHESGQKRRRVMRRRTRAGQIFREAALSVAGSKDLALGAFYRRLSARKGPAIAMVALARKLAELYYWAMTQGLEYVEQGVQQYQARVQHSSLQRLSKQARELGLQLVPIHQTAPPSTPA